MKKIACFTLWVALICLLIFQFKPYTGRANSLSWNVISFQINWPDGERPNWYVGPLLAKEVFFPVILENNANLPLWRFHRRASRDKAGHKFSFIFYTNASVAEKIFLQVKKNLILEWLFYEGIIVDGNYVYTEKYGEGDLSDPSWSPAMQMAWPEYAMGVSKTWLKLLIFYSGNIPQKKEKIIRNYEEIQKGLSVEWRREARHALFHHANAIFAYVPFLSIY